jgi:hypothetical protein
MKAEIWKDIPNYEGLYQISNFGKVRSFDRLIKRGNGVILMSGRVMKPHLKKEYHGTTLTKDGKTKRFFIHRLVMLAFVGQSDLHVDHINAIKNDNRLENLRYCTNLENARYYSEKHRECVIRRGPIKVKSSRINGLYSGVILGQNNIYARVCINGKDYHLGTFKSAENAGSAYQLASSIWKKYGILPQAKMNKKYAA